MRSVLLALLLIVASRADAIDLQLTSVASGLANPLYLTHAGDDRLFIIEQRGRIRIMRNGAVLPTPFLDITPLLSTGNEQGLLGLAFPPDYATSGRFYVYYTATNGDSVLARYRVGSNPDLADAASREILLQFAQPFSNHNGGWIAFGPDGFLYVASGDGGSANDPQDNGQQLNTLLGKLLRLNVSGASAQAAPGNPFATTSGARAEIWAYGLRNPWRASFDRQTGDLWIGDVGQSRREEINFQPAGSGGQNYGWRRFEGTLCGTTNTNCGSTEGFTMPVNEYDRALGCSVTGGYVYRGNLYPRLRGRYFFSDFCSGRIWSIERSGSGASATYTRTEHLATGLPIASFGEDRSGNLYALAFNGQVYLISDGEPLTGPLIDASFTGSWFDPAQNGHGFFVEVLPGGSFVAWWFTFSPEGQQAWFGGVGQISGNRAVVNAVRTTGGRFIPNFNPAAVQNEPFGTLTFTFTSCRAGQVAFNLPQGYSQGTMALTRLTVPDGISCAP
jgi:glucose/arabinose dehydrogenase